MGDSRAVQGGFQWRRLDQSRAVAVRAHIYGRHSGDRGCGRLGVLGKGPWSERGSSRLVYSTKMVRVVGIVEEATSFFYKGKPKHPQPDPK